MKGGKKRMESKEKRHECFNMAEEENLSRTKGSSLSQSFRYANRIEVPTFSLRFSLRFGFCARSARLLPLIRAVSTRDTVRTMFPSTLFLFFPILFFAFPLSSSTWAFPPIENNSPTDVRQSALFPRDFRCSGSWSVANPPRDAACQIRYYEKARPVCVMKSLTDQPTHTALRLTQFRYKSRF